MILKCDRNRNIYIIDDFIYQFKFPFISSNMYIMFNRECKNALIIDPHKNQDAAQLLKAADIKKVLIVLTHEHFDHTSGIPWLQKEFECQIYCQNNALQHISQKRNNRPVLAYMLKNEYVYQKQLKDYFCEFSPYTYTADKVCQDLLVFKWNSHELSMKYAPGHSPASVLIEMDKQYIFTGDSLIPNVQVITRFPGGNQEIFETVTLPFLKEIGKEKIILPGHGQPIEYKQLYYDDFVFKICSDEE